jgi:uncharacterized membrane protein YgcG
MTFHYRSLCIVKTWFVAIILFAFLFSVPQTIFAQNTTEKINQFHTEITVGVSGDISVQETIVYDFGDNEKRGIFREIPLNKAPGSIKKLDIKLLSVTDALGGWYNASTEDSSTNWFHLRIGNPDVYITGEHTYVINYRVQNAIGSFKDFSEIYWNSTGNDWEVPIANASTRIILPSVIDRNNLQIASYCGESGSNDICSGDVQISYENSLTIVDFGAAQFQNLQPKQGMTVAVSFPKGIVAEPSWLLALFHRVVPYIFYFLPLAVVYVWFRKRMKFWQEKRKFYRDNTIVVEYDAREHDPLEAAGIMDGYVSDRALSAQIIHLAIQGYLIIDKQGDEFVFHGTEKPYDQLSAHDQKLVEGLRDKKESDLINSFYTVSDDVKDISGKLLVSRGYLQGVTSGKAPRFVFIFLAFFLALNPGVFVWLLLGNYVGFAFSASCILVGLISFIIGPKWVYLTQTGLQAERKLLGLKTYIDMAEKDRIDFHNAPKKNPETFEKLLPYAMVFGLEKKWAEQFKDITINTSWYRAGDGTLSTILVAASMQNFASKTGSVISSRPVSQSSGGGFSGGSSGGGSSGGGGGGGGGGSW